MSGVSGTVDLNITTAQDTGHGRDVLISIEDVTGTSGNDTIIGDSNANMLDGGAGNDLLLGGGGNDTIIGGAGIDVALFSGRRGDATFTYSNGAIGVIGADGSDTLQSVEVLQFTDGVYDVRTDGLVASSARVNFAGTANADVVRSGDSNDLLQGGLGDDFLDAGIGTDRLEGGAGNDVLNGGADDDVIDGGAGVDLAVFSAASTQVTFAYMDGTIVVIGPDGRDVLTDVEQLRFSDRVLDVGADGRVITALNTIAGTSGADTLTGTSGSDALLGGAGNDLLRGQSGSDVLNGGEGFDAALYSGVRRQYSTASSTAVSGGPEGGTDSLISIEEARFVDGVLTFDVNSQAAQVMRLYDAALDRGGDPGGLESLLDRLERGETLLSLASAFLTSPEFQQRYGALNNQAFIEQMYRFCLNRNGDPAGIQTWTDRLNSGTTRAEMLVIFSESQEHRDLTAGTLAQGLWVADEGALTIARLYDATFDRLPDAGGLATWVNNLRGGMAILDIAAAFASAPEFQQRYGTVTNQQFIEQMYRFCLDREPDAGGLSFWTNALNTGTSRAQMLLTFSESAEHVGLTASQWLGGVRYAGFIGAPAEDQPVKGLDDAQVLPGGLDHDGTYDPADFSIGILDKAHEAFVLPATPDGGLQPWIPTAPDDIGLNDFGLDLFTALDTPTPLDEGLFRPDIALTLPSDSNTDDLSFGFQKGGYELNWA
ncbi:DUF4214 domain-containing protein [Brevundimonas sp. DC300-4]|uniref:DUF4214 domain-containing protein n=1 Tax=Brevundimonas sp. DC300-4 TaxID=2804594 RepID=UPI003CF4FA3B